MINSDLNGYILCLVAFRFKTRVTYAFMKFEMCIFKGICVIYKELTERPGFNINV